MPACLLGCLAGGDAGQEVRATCGCCSQIGVAGLGLELQHERRGTFVASSAQCVALASVTL